jgi:prevent-host-death family protein
MKWRMADARNRFNELVARALAEGPQRIVFPGGAVVLTAEHDYEKLTGRRVGFKHFLIRKGPGLEGLDLKRDCSHLRHLKL